MDALAPFRIPVANLKAEKARYHWDLQPDFFRIFDDEHETEKGQFAVDLELAHEGTITTLCFNISGVVETPCDRCLAQIDMPIAGEYELLVKFGNLDETTDEVIMVDPEANGLNLGQHIYDFVLLSIPISRRIPGCESSENPPCDMTVLSYLSKIEENNNSAQGDDDLPWGDLKKVIDN